LILVGASSLTIIPILYFGYLSYQTLFDETPVQEQDSGNSPIGNDPVDVGNNPVVGAQTADSPIRHTPDGKEIMRLAYSSVINMNKNLLLPLQISAQEI